MHAHPPRCSVRIWACGMRREATCDLRLPCASPLRPRLTARSLPPNTGTAHTCYVIEPPTVTSTQHLPQGFPEGPERRQGPDDVQLLAHRPTLTAGAAITNEALGASYTQDHPQQSACGQYVELAVGGGEPGQGWLGQAAQRILEQAGRWPAEVALPRCVKDVGRPEQGAWGKWGRREGAGSASGNGMRMARRWGGGGCAALLKT